MIPTGLVKFPFPSTFNHVIIMATGCPMPRPGMALVRCCVFPIIMNAHWHTSPKNSQYEPPGGDTFKAAATRYWPPNHLGFAATGR